METHFAGIKLDAICMLGGGFRYVLFSSLFGEDSHFDYIIFFRWVETTKQYGKFEEFPLW